MIPAVTYHFHLSPFVKISVKLPFKTELKNSIGGLFLQLWNDALTKFEEDSDFLSHRGLFASSCFLITTFFYVRFLISIRIISVFFISRLRRRFSIFRSFCLLNFLLILSRLLILNCFVACLSLLILFLLASSPSTRKILSFCLILLFGLCLLLFTLYSQLLMSKTLFFLTLFAPNYN